MPVYFVEGLYTSTTKLCLVPGQNGTKKKQGQKKGSFLRKKKVFFSGFGFFSALYCPAGRTGMYASGGRPGLGRKVGTASGS